MPRWTLEPLAASVVARFAALGISLAGALTPTVVVAGGCRQHEVDPTVEAADLKLGDEFAATHGR